MTPFQGYPQAPGGFGFQAFQQPQSIKAYQFQEVHEDRPEDIYLTKKEFQEWISSIQNRKQNGGNSDESSKK